MHAINSACFYSRRKRDNFPVLIEFLAVGYMHIEKKHEWADLWKNIRSWRNVKLCLYTLRLYKQSLVVYLMNVNDCTVHILLKRPTNLALVIVWNLKINK